MLISKFNKLIILTYIIFFLIYVTGEHHCHSTRRKIYKVTPKPWFNI